MGTGSISVVVPTYGVAAYLPAFLASIQTSMDAAVDADPAAASRVEFVFVDDGSPDASAAIIAEWIERRPDLAARLVRQDNGGLSSARNAGLDVATGDWVTFPDPDDFVDRSYLGVLSRFTASPEADTVHIVCGRTIFYDHDGGTYRNTHPLRHRFDGGTRIVDLGREPHQIHVAANTGLFRRDVIEAYGLRFDAAVRPVWEDGHFTARYLSKFERPRIAMMADAVYNYRQRADGSSLMDGQWVDPDKFRTVPRKGWLDALRIAAAEHDGHVPPWIQNMVLYDLRGYFKNERRSPSRTANTPAEVSRDFFELLHEIFEHIDLDVLDRFRGSYIPLEVRQVLRMTFKGAGPRPTEIALDTLDTDRGLVRLHYFYLGAAPVESFRARGLVVAPVHAKTRPCAFYGHVLGYERVVWLPAVTSLSATLDGVATPLRAGPADIPRLEISRTTIWQTLTGSPPAAAPGSGLRRRLGRAKRDLQRHARWFTDDTERQRTAAQATLRLSRTPFYRHRYRDAWLLIDRDSQAQDNAEHLYRWLRANRPKVNAFFVLARSSPDWARLSAEGFRLVDHRSREHDIALLNARHVLSSQIDNYITSPQSAELFGPENVGRWHYTFLQHGVTKDDLSIWINTKPIDLMITATPDEYRSIVDDTSPYIFSDREVKLTGFPRHDRLLELARGPEGKEPDARPRHADVASFARARNGCRRQRPRAARRLLADRLRDRMALAARVRGPAPQGRRARLPHRVRAAPEHAGLPRHQPAARERPGTAVQRGRRPAADRAGRRAGDRLLLDGLRDGLHRASGGVLPVRPARFLQRRARLPPWVLELRAGRFRAGHRRRRHRGRRDRRDPRSRWARAGPRRTDVRHVPLSRRRVLPPDPRRGRRDDRCSHRRRAVPHDRGARGARGTPGGRRAARVAACPRTRGRPPAVQPPCGAPCAGVRGGPPVPPPPATAPPSSSSPGGCRPT